IGCISPESATADDILESSPDVILIEAVAPYRRSIDCVRRIRTFAPDIPIIMIGKTLGMELLFESVATGVSGFLVMPVDPRGCAEAIEEVYRGGVAFPGFALRMMMHVLRGAGDTDQNNGEPDPGD